MNANENRRTLNDLSIAELLRALEANTKAVGIESYSTGCLIKALHEKHEQMAENAKAQKRGVER